MLLVSAVIMLICNNVQKCVSVLKRGECVILLMVKYSIIVFYLFGSLDSVYGPKFIELEMMRDI